MHFPKKETHGREQIRVTVFDTTLRDGEQSPGCSMNHQEKLRLAHQLDRLGVDVIEAGFPIASDGDFEAVKAIAEVIRRPIIAGLARACRPDIERAWDALKDAACPRIHVFLATSDIHLQYKLRITRDQCLAQARDAVRFAKSLCDDVEFSPEDATRTDPDFLCRVLEAVVEAGATTLNIPDTVGYTVPAEFGELIATIRRPCEGNRERHHFGALPQRSWHGGSQYAWLPSRPEPGKWSARSMASENAQATPHWKRLSWPCGFAGTAIRTRPALPREQLFAASQMLSEITGVPVQPNKAVTGRNAFAHEAGIHQDGVLKNPLTYEIMTPQSVGVPDSKLVLGKHSGRHALNIRCEQLGYQFDRRALDDIYRRFVRLADKIKHVEDHHLLELIRDTHKPSASATPLFEPLSVRGSVRAFRPRSAASISAGSANQCIRCSARPFRGDQHHDQEDYLWGV